MRKWCYVLDHLHQYVPTASIKQIFNDPESQEKIEVFTDVCDPIILGNVVDVFC